MQAEYDKEDIRWEHIEFKDNQEILDLLAAKPLNIISLIDEESCSPEGTDLSMLKKLHNQHQGNDHYLKSDEVHAFGIAHFAGNVFYQAKGVLEKNRDTFSNDLFDLLQMSKARHLLELFAGERAMVKRGWNVGRRGGRHQRPARRLPRLVYSSSAPWMTS